MDGTLAAVLIGCALAIGLAIGWTASQRKLGSAQERAGKAEGEVASCLRQLQAANETLEKNRRTGEDQAASLARAETERDSATHQLTVQFKQLTETRAQLEATRNEARTLQDERAQLRERNGALEILNSRNDQELKAQRQWFEDQSKHLQALFAKTANELLDDKAAKFGSTNKEQIEALMKPFQLQLGDFRKRVDELHTAETGAQARLENQIANLAQKAADVGTTASNLASAMLGNAKKQGDWGELQLVTLLEQAGFVKGRHFDTQVGARDDDASRRYADVVLWLPEDRCLVIDSKLTLPSWVIYCSTEGTEARKAALASIIKSMREHCEDLAAIDYAQIISKVRSVPFTLMFIPIEAAGIEAFRTAPDLFTNAQKRKVIMVTPTTLFCVLQLVHGLWSLHDRHVNSLRIAEQGRLLLRKLGSFAGSFKTVGDKLAAATASYDTARSQLQSGPGNLVSIADRMAKLGVESPKDGELAKLFESGDTPVSEAVPRLSVQDPEQDSDSSTAGVSR